MKRTLLFLLVFVSAFAIAGQRNSVLSTKPTVGTLTVDPYPYRGKHVGDIVPVYVVDGGDQFMTFRSLTPADLPDAPIALPDHVADGDVVTLNGSISPSMSPDDLQALAFALLGQFIQPYQIAGGASGNILVSDGHKMVSVAMSGDAQIDHTGAVLVTKVQGHLFDTSTPADASLPVYNNGAAKFQYQVIGSDASMDDVGNLTVKRIRNQTWKNVSPGDANYPAWNSTNSDWEPVSFSGDVTVDHAGVATLASTAVTAGTYPSDAAHVPSVTFDAKGRATGASSVSIAIDASQTTSGTFAAARIPLATTSQAGAVATLPNDATKFFNGVGGYTVPAGGTGTVTSVTSGNFSPLFNVTVGTNTTTPAFSYAAITQNANLGFYGPSSGAAAAPGFRSMVPLDFAGSSATGGLAYSSSSTVNAWLGIGSSNQVLTVVSGAPAWQTWSTGLPAATTLGKTLYDTGSAYAESTVLQNDNTKVTITPTSTNTGLTVNAGTSGTAVFTNSVTPGAGSGAGLTLETTGTPSANAQNVGFLEFSGITTGSTVANGAAIVAASGQAWGPSAAGTNLLFETVANSATTQTERMRIWADGDISVNRSGSALATNTLLGFFHIPNMAGVPSGGSPTRIQTGATPIVYDSSDNRLYAYNSGWQNLTPGTNAFNTAASGPVTLTSSQIPGVFVGTNGAGLTLNLPTATSVGVTTVQIVARGGSFITVTPNGSDTVNGAATLTVATGHSAILTSNGSNQWFVVATS